MRQHAEVFVSQSPEEVARGPLIVILMGQEEKKEAGSLGNGRVCALELMARVQISKIYRRQKERSTGQI